MAQLEPFSSLDIPVEEIRPTAHARFFCGYIPQESLDEAQKLAEEYEGLFVKMCIRDSYKLESFLDGDMQEMIDALIFAEK